jgi:hypothetical protein
MPKAGPLPKRLEALRDYLIDKLSDQRNSIPLD